MLFQSWVFTDFFNNLIKSIKNSTAMVIFYMLSFDRCFTSCKAKRHTKILRFSLKLRFLKIRAQLNCTLSVYEIWGAEIIIILHFSDLYSALKNLHLKWSLSNWWISYPFIKKIRFKKIRTKARHNKTFLWIQLVGSQIAMKFENFTAKISEYFLWIALIVKSIPFAIILVLLLK